MAINYSKVGWNVSPYKYANPTNMNQMDSGIKAACDGVDALASVPDDVRRLGGDDWGGSYNLIKFPYYRESGYSQNGITFTYDDSGVITLNGTSTDSAAFAPMETGNFDAYIPIEDGVTYRVIFERINVAEGTLLYFKHRFVNSEGAEETGNHTSATTGFYFTGSSDIRKFGINVGVYGAGGVCNNAQIKVMLVKQTADGKYPTVYQRWYESNKVITDKVAEEADAIASNSYGSGGRNLIPFPYSRAMYYTHNGIKFTYGDDGIIYANGTATADAYFEVKSRTEIFSGLKPSTSYVVSGVSGGSSTTYDMYVSFRDANDSKTTNDAIVYNSPVVFSFSSQTAKIGISIRIKNGQTVSNLAFKPMLELGTVVHDYEPYYKSNKVLTDEVRESSGRLSDNGYGDVGGRNLIPYPYYSSSTTNNGITWDVYPDGTIIANGTATADSNITIAQRANTKNFALGVGTYTLSGCPSGGSTSKYWLVMNYTNSSGGGTNYGSDVGNGFTFNVTSSTITTNSHTIQCFVKNGQTVSNLVFKPMLEVGSVAHDYEPYFKSNKTLTDNVSDKDGIAFLGWSCPDAMPIKNYRDASGVFHQRVGRVDIGKVNWKYNSDNGYFYESLSDAHVELSVNNNQNIYCSKYAYRGYNTSLANMATAKNGLWKRPYNETNIFIKDTNYTDATQFRNSMSGQYLYYELNSEITFADGKEQSVKSTSKTYAFTNGLADSGIPLTNVPIAFVGTNRSGYAFTFMRNTNISDTNWAVYGFNVGGVISNNASGTLYYI